MNGIDDCAGTQEKQRLEKGMGEKVKHRCFSCRYSNGGHHVTELRERRVSQDAFDVTLLRRHQRGQYSGHDAHPCNHLTGTRYQREQEGNLDEQVDARCDHRCCVDQR